MIHNIWFVDRTSATSLVSIRNIRVFRTALTALTEPRTLWRRITHFPSPCIALAKCILVTGSLQKCLRGCGVYTKMRQFQESIRPQEGILAGLQSNWECRRQAWECWWQAWEHLESQSCIQFVFSSMYLCIYIATHLHTLYLDWLQAVLDSNSRCDWKWRSSELRDIHRGRDQVTLEMHLEVVIERIWRYISRPWWSELWDALRDRDWASLEVHLGRQ